MRSIDYIDYIKENHFKDELKTALTISCPFFFIFNVSFNVSFVSPHNSPL